MFFSTSRAAVAGGGKTIFFPPCQHRFLLRGVVVPGGAYSVRLRSKNNCNKNTAVLLSPPKKNANIPLEKTRNLIPSLSETSSKNDALDTSQMMARDCLLNEQAKSAAFSTPTTNYKERLIPKPGGPPIDPPTSVARQCPFVTNLTQKHPMYDPSVLHPQNGPVARRTQQPQSPRYNKDRTVSLSPRPCRGPQPTRFLLKFAPAILDNSLTSSFHRWP